jgi:hypothetical protein
LCTAAGFYRYAVEEDLLDHSPAAHVRRPRLDSESHATALDRNEVGSLLVAAGLGKAAEHAQISLLTLNGCVSPKPLARTRGARHRTRTPHADRAQEGRQDSEHPACPPHGPGHRPHHRRTGRGSDLLAPRWQRMDRHAAARIVDRAAKQAGLGAKRSAHTLCDTRSSPPRWTPGSHCATSKKPLPMLIREPRCVTTRPASHSTGTPPRSSPPTLPVLLDKTLGYSMLTPRRRARRQSHAPARPGRAVACTGPAVVVVRANGSFSDVRASRNQSHASPRGHRVTPRSRSLVGLLSRITRQPGHSSERT